jgi:predicted DNA binding CopG/RHH family protein
MKKKLPEFKNEDDERKFWATADSTEYVDWQAGKRKKLVQLKPSLRTISLRLPVSMIEDLKVLANRRDVPYQSLTQGVPGRATGARAPAAAGVAAASTNPERLRNILARGEQLATATKPRRPTADGDAREERLEPARCPGVRSGSLEAELSAIGKAVPAREWAKVPADYFANLDHYLHGAPKKK